MTRTAIAIVAFALLEGICAQRTTSIFFPFDEQGDVKGATMDNIGVDSATRTTWRIHGIPDQSTYTLVEGAQDAVFSAVVPDDTGETITVFASCTLKAGRAACVGAIGTDTRTFAKAMSPVGVVLGTTLSPVTTTSTSQTTSTTTTQSTTSSTTSSRTTATSPVSQNSGQPPPTQNTSSPTPLPTSKPTGAAFSTEVAVYVMVMASLGTVAALLG